MTEAGTREVAGAGSPPPPPPFPPDVPGRVTSPAQKLSADFRTFQLLEAARYTWWNPLEAPRHERNLLRLEVPEDFTHDFASVPRVLWMLISPLDLGVASIFHDWLYRKGGRVTTLRWDRADGRWDPVEEPWSRRYADELFARMMREHGVPRWRRRVAYLAVRFAGGRHWHG